MIYNVYISSWERTVPNRERAVPNMPSIYTGWRSDSWQRVAGNEGGSSQVGTDRSQMSMGRSQCSSGIRDRARSWRLEMHLVWQRAAPSWELAAPNFSSVKFIVQIVAVRNAFGLAAGRSQRRQISFCSVFSHEYIYPCLLHEITNKKP